MDQKKRRWKKSTVFTVTCAALCMTIAGGPIACAPKEQPATGSKGRPAAGRPPGDSVSIDAAREKRPGGKHAVHRKPGHLSEAAAIRLAEAAWIRGGKCRCTSGKSRKCTCKEVMIPAVGAIRDGNGWLVGFQRPLLDDPPRLRVVRVSPGDPPTARILDRLVPVRSGPWTKMLRVRSSGKSNRPGGSK